MASSAAAACGWLAGEEGAEGAARRSCSLFCPSRAWPGARSRPVGVEGGCVLMQRNGINVPEREERGDGGRAGARRDASF